MDLTAMAAAITVCPTGRKRRLSNGQKIGLQPLTAKLLRVMKLTTVFILAGSLHLAATGNAQQVNLNLQNVSLKTVFFELKKQTDYNFLFSDEVLAGAKPVSIVVKKATIEEVLSLCFKDQPLTYTIIQNSIVIKPKGGIKLENETSVFSLPPPLDVRGRVVNEDAESVHGVTVTVKGTKNATATNEKGEFVLQNVDDKAVLVFTSIQMQTLETAVGGRNFVTVQLKKKVSALDDVKIIAYGTTTERLRTGAVGTVKAETIEKQPVGDVLLALKGQVPGLKIMQSTGVPGARVEFNIRGINSLNALLGLGTNDPLVIVDGVPLLADPIITQPFNQANNQYRENGGLSPLAAINPADIERIDVLKDADATAIYGSRGANGVLLITTKKAKPGKPTLNVDFSKGIGRVGRKLDMLTTRQYLDMRYEAFANDGIDWRAPNVFANDLKMWDTTRYTDWQKEIAGGTANYTRANVSYSGGNKQNSISLAGNYWKEGSIFGEEFSSQTISGRVGFNHRTPNDRFLIEMSAFFSKVENLQPSINPFTSAISMLPHAPKLYNDDGSLNWENGTFTNPMADLLKTHENTSHQINARTLLSYKLVKNLWLKTEVGYGKSDVDVLNRQPNSAYSPFLNPGPGPLSRRLEYVRRSNTSTNLEPYVQYEAKLGPGKLNALAGFSLQTQGTEFHRIEANDFLSDDMLRNYGVAGSLRANPVDMGEYRYAAVYARLNYNIYNKYLVNLSARRDGSSRFGPGKQFGNFGAIGAAWIFSEETAIKNALPFLSMGKLRLSYGITGSDNIGNYKYLSLYAVRVIPGSTVFQPPYTVLNPVSLFNPDFHWESNRKADVELTLGFFKDRILATANYYRNRSSNQLVGQPLPPTTGFPSVTENRNATVQNSGLELQLTTENVKSKNFSWSSSFNLSSPRNKLISYPGLSSSPNALSFEVGRPLSFRRTFDYIGVNPQTGLNHYRIANGKDTSFNSTSRFTIADRTVYLSLMPRYFGGFTNNVQFKNWGLSIMLDYSRSIKVNDISVFSNVPGFAGNITQYVYHNSWRKPGDQALFQKFTQTPSSPAYYSAAGNLTEQYYDDIWYVRLNNLSLSYDLPSQLTHQLRLTSCRVYINSQNLFTLTNFKGIDPEFGVDAMPPLQVFTAGVKLNF